MGECAGCHEKWHHSSLFNWQSMTVCAACYAMIRSVIGSQALSGVIIPEETMAKAYRTVMREPLIELG